MQCPVCDERLRAVERGGVEIDICPGCKGVWLDRGELEKLLAIEAGERALPVADERHPRDAAPRRDDEYRHDRHDERHDDRGHRQQYDRNGRPVQQKRSSWLGDILGSFGGGED